jgi:nickel/cobalt transporter (NicO) family protein
MRSIFLFFALLVLACGAVECTAWAQVNGSQESAPKIDKRKLIVPPRNPDGSLITTPFFEDPVEWLREKQREFSGAMSGAMRNIKTGAPLAAATTLILLSFGYGIFHAAGPGHGKAVISAWLLATENELRRGILVAFMSAAVQALTAIVIVTALLMVVSAVGSTARNVANFMQSASFALIAAMGIWLMASAFRARAEHKPHAHADHDHHDLHHPHEHHDGHEHDERCGHAHLPGAIAVKGDWSWAKASSLAFAVGIRPCNGAILALIFAYSIGLYWAGIASTLVMALGTAITVSIIAALAVYSRSIAVRLAAGKRAWLDRLGFGLKLAGGAAIATFGGLLFWTSLWTTQLMM